MAKVDLTQVKLEDLQGNERLLSDWLEGDPHRYHLLIFLRHLA